MEKILIIDDDLELAELLQDFLQCSGYEVCVCEDPFIGISELKLTKFDLLILDLTLPGLDGLEVCKEIRLTSQIPIIISSARADLNDKLEAFDLGADDYMPKPYDPQELLARIKGRLKRVAAEEAQKAATKKEFTVDEFRHEVLRNGEALELSLAEYEVLSYLILMEGGTISREELIINSTSINIETGSKSIDVLVSRLRNKIGDDGKNPTHIKSIRGVGYKFVQ